MRLSRVLCVYGRPHPTTHAGGVSVLGIPIDLGGNHRGVDMGPLSVRVAGLNALVRGLGYDVEDLGNVFVPAADSLGPPPNPKARYEEQIAVVCQEVAEKVRDAMGRGRIPIALGGDHSAAVGTISGTASHFRARDDDLGVIWVDAHTDMNTPETTPSGNIHGMPMACLLGHGPKSLTSILASGGRPHLNPKQCVFIGIRDVDESELELVHRSGVTVFTMEDVDLLGAREVMRRALEIANRGTSGFHFSFDLDGVDPEVAPGVGTPVQGGLTFREAHMLCEMANASGRMVAMDVMETNPALDSRVRSCRGFVLCRLSRFG